MSTIAYVTALPTCDIHHYMKNTPGVPAAYDGKTVFGSWANMCDDCFTGVGVGLGTGRGQALKVRTDSPHLRDEDEPCAGCGGRWAGAVLAHASTCIYMAASLLFDPDDAA